jgi:transcriptional regulator with XRE-family HTH domain
MDAVYTLPSYFDDVGDMREARQQFAARLRRALGSRSQEWLAAQVGVKQATVSKWLLAENWPRAEIIPQIEQALGIPPGELVAFRLGADPDAIAEVYPPRERSLEDLIDCLEQARAALNRAEEIARRLR